MEVFHPVITGATIQILQLGDRLIKMGNQVIVVTRQINPGDPEREIYKGVDVVRVKPAIGLKRTGKYLMLLPALVALWKERGKYDLIIVCDLKILGILGVIAGKLFRKKCFLRAESCGEMNGSFATQFGNRATGMKNITIRMLVWLRNYVLKKADGFLSICSPIEQEYLECGVEASKIIRIPNGIDIEHFAPLSGESKQALRERLGLTGKRYFLFTGRLARGKGLEYLLRVWNKLSRKYPHIHLLLIGSGQGYGLDCEDELKKFVRDNSLESSVTFTGNVDNVSDYLRAGDFYVLPSQIEALSISLLEAMSCGLPVVTTAVGGTVDIIDDGVNAISIPYGMEESLSDALEKLLKDDELSGRVAWEGRRTVLEKYDIDQIAKHYRSLLDVTGETACHP